MRCSTVFLLVPLLAVPAHAQGTARGVVFQDANHNGIRDAGETGVPNVAVSNGHDVVTTDHDGAYELPIENDNIIFIVKPRHFMTPLTDRHIPRFHYIHKPAGSPPVLKHRGVPPTGPLPDSIDFPLVARPEPDDFKVILFGDPQPYSIEQVNEFAHDVVEEVIGEQRRIDAAFGVSLGDLVGDDLSLFTPYNDVVASIGTPWYSVLGNHDMNLDVGSDDLSDETYERFYGPPTYAFQHGPVLFVVLDNVVYEGAKPDGSRGGYHSTLTRDQMSFLRGLRDVAPIAFSDVEMVVFMMHIPLVELTNKDELLDLVGHVPSFSLAAHWHRHGTHFLEHQLPATPDGAHTDHVHVHVVQGTTSGSWWQGAPDEYGLPHAMMRDGKPNGWSVLAFDRDEGGTLSYAIRCKAARRPWSDQLHLWAPDEIAPGEASDTRVIANVYAGSERSVVEMRVRNAATGEVSSWRAMEMYTGVDPYWEALKKQEESEHPPRGRRLTNLNPEALLWRGALPANLAPGPHVVEVRTTDMFGQSFDGRRVIRVVAPGDARGRRGTAR